MCSLTSPPRLMVPLARSLAATVTEISPLQPLGLHTPPPAQRKLGSRRGGEVRRGGSRGGGGDRLKERAESAPGAYPHTHPPTYTLTYLPTHTLPTDLHRCLSARTVAASSYCIEMRAVATAPRAYDCTRDRSTRDRSTRDRYVVEEISAVRLSVSAPHHLQVLLVGLASVL